LRARSEPRREAPPIRGARSDYDDEDEEAEEEPQVPEITIPPEWVPGAYSNASVVTWNAFEFTIDVVRMDPYHATGVVVARISCSSQAANDLALELGRELRAWAEWVMSQEGGDGNGQTHYRPTDPGSDPSA